MKIMQEYYYTDAEMAQLAEKWSAYLTHLPHEIVPRTAAILENQSLHAEGGDQLLEFVGVVPTFCRNFAGFDLVNVQVLKYVDRNLQTTPRMAYTGYPPHGAARLLAGELADRILEQLQHDAVRKTVGAEEAQEIFSGDSPTEEIDWFAASPQNCERYLGLKSAPTPPPTAATATISQLRGRNLIRTANFPDDQILCGPKIMGYHFDLLLVLDRDNRSHYRIAHTHDYQYNKPGFSPTLFTIAEKPRKPTWRFLDQE